MSTQRKFQPYFVSYALSQGRTPTAQLAHDTAEYVGGCMCGFILWISAMKQAHRECFLDPHVIANHKAWGRFLRTRAKAAGALLA